MPAAPPLDVAVVGPGTIGLAVGKLVQQHDRLTLIGMVGRDTARTKAALADALIGAPVLTLDGACSSADIIVDAAPPTAFGRIAETALSAGRVLVTVNSGALLDHWELVDLAAVRGGRIIIATGALLGLDAVRAAAVEGISSVSMITRKPTRAFYGIDHAESVCPNLRTLTEPVRLYHGPVRNGVRHYPSNVNVAMSLALAGVGPDKTTLEIWADPDLERNTHVIEVDAAAASFQLRIQNVPTPSNPATGRITALSVFDAIRGLGCPLRVGS